MQLEKVSKIESITRNSWKFSPMNLPVPLKYSRILSHGEWELLKKGFSPKVMEDKWFVFQEDNIIYFARSWTGYCIFSVEIKILNNETVLLHKAKMESSKNIYRGDTPDSTLDDLITMVIECNSK